MSASKVLERLERVKHVGAGRWRAGCPAHDDRTPSLSIRELDDGRVLLHCFADCEVGDVLAALGLGMSDLFEKPIGHQLPAARGGLSARDVLDVVDHEMVVACIILADVIRERRITEKNYSRLALAAARIGGARDYANR